MTFPQSTQTEFPRVIFSETNGYALQKELSHKAGRRTFIAKELTTHTPVILKFLQFGGAVVGSKLSWEDIKLFKREAQILQHLSHPKIPQYKASFETEIAGIQTFVLVQTFIPAPSLQSVVEAGELFTEEAVVAIAQQLLTTLVYLHSQLPPVIHRDLKPSNILISDPNPKASSGDTVERQIYLIDFGAVQITATRNSGTVTIVGSYGYMPLEQFIGQTTPASDLYSLGMTLLYLLTGIHPAELPQANGRIQLEKLCEKAGLSQRFIHWISQLIAPQLEQRFESAAIALKALTVNTRGSGYFPQLRPKNSFLFIERDRNQLQIILDWQYVSNLYEQKRPAIAWILYVLIFGASILLLMYAAAIVFLLLVFIATSSINGFCVAALVVASIYLVGYVIWKSAGTEKRLAGDKQTKLTSRRQYAVISIEKDIETQRAHQAVSLRLGRAKSTSPDQVRKIKWTNRLFSKPSSERANQDYCFLSLTYGHRFTHLYTHRDKVKDNTVRLLPKLSIHLGNEIHTLSHIALTAEELLWAGKEISAFLDAPLHEIKMTDADAYKAQRSQSAVKTSTRTNRG